MIRTGDVYLIPLLPGKQALVTIVGLGNLPWEPFAPVMLVEAYNCLIPGPLPTDLPTATVARYWCVVSFAEVGNWSLVRREGAVTSERLPARFSVWATHELFLDDLRQRLGLERQTYKGAEFTFSTNCRRCGAPLRL